MVINMTSSEDGWKILRSWSMEKTPCSISVAGNGFNLSAIGILAISTSNNEISLSWNGGSLGFTFDNLPLLETLDSGTLQVRLPFGMFVLICQSPEIQNKTVN
jgi:hypothetical protein